MNRLLPLLGLFILLLTARCNPYRQVSIDPNTFYNNTKVPKRIDAYHVYIHEGQKLYTLSDRTFGQDTLRGVLEEIPASAVNAHPESRKELRDSRKDMHVYLLKPASQLLTTQDTAALVKRVAIDRKSVDRVDMFAKNEKNVFARGGLVLGIVIIGLLIVFSLLFAAIKGSEDAAGKGSGSDSNSGDSDSGGSDSGGSDSGCYVATMVYGSYDAPNVLVLRAFRDGFLQKSGFGRRFIAWYYANSPRFVARHRDKVLLGKLIRGSLNVFVWLIRPFFGS